MGEKKPNIDSIRFTFLLFLNPCKGKISYFCSEEFNLENSKCCHSSLPCVNLENAINDPTTQNPVGPTDQIYGPASSPMTDLWNLFSQETDTLLNMFPVEEILNQGDKDIQVADNYINTFIDNKHLIPTNLEDLKFLDTYQGGGEVSNMDCQDINFMMEPAEGSINLSSLIDFSCDFSSDMPVQELSYDLNSVPEMIDLNLWNSSVNNQNSSQFQVQIKEVTSSDIKPLSPKSQSDLSVDLDEISQESKSNEKSHLDAKKYREMRRKNNIASQRSRKIRKQKESQLSEQLKRLEKENAELLLLHDKLEKERDTLQKYFLEFIAKK
ncbi:BZIP domain-containing protein [Trichonephila clavata]|uniref:BZIP domain-containing protein n=1 Tax=Trichonephila clavata TaxID=2740835 RepID=A0A8X6F3F0_TRICU|nr:BZIP domain-containing protein [Trichonephila clavata]